MGSGVWNYTTQKVSNCRLQVFDRPFEAYCMARNVELEGSGTVSKDSKVDFYKGRYTDEKNEFYEDLGFIMEQGSTSIPLQERVDGFHHNRTYHYEVEWWEHREFFNFKTSKID